MDDDDFLLYGEALSPPKPKSPSPIPEVKVELKTEETVSDIQPVLETQSQPEPLPEPEPEPDAKIGIEITEKPASPTPSLESCESDDESIDIILELPPEGEGAAHTDVDGLVRLKVAGDGARANVADNKTGGTLDLNTVAYLDGEPLFDVQLEDLDEKPWRKPGADLTDYFNYGFDERSWLLYCQRQQQLREAGGLATGMVPLRPFAVGGAVGLDQSHHRMNPARYTIDLPKQRHGAIQVVAGSDRERDAGGGVETDATNQPHLRHPPGRPPQPPRDFPVPQFPMGMFPPPNIMGAALPPLSYSLTGPSIQQRGGLGFNPTQRPPSSNTHSNSNSNNNPNNNNNSNSNSQWRNSARSPSPNPDHEPPESKPRGHRSRRLSPSPARSRASSSHRSSREKDHNPPPQQQSSHSSRSRRDGGDDWESSEEYSKKRESGNRPREKDRDERRRDKDRDHRSHQNSSSAAPNSGNSKFSGSQSKNTKTSSRDKDRRPTSPDDYKDSNQGRKTMRDRLGSKLASEEQQRKRSSKSLKDDSGHPSSSSSRKHHRH